MTLTKDQRSLIALMKRSTRGEDGWYTVSRPVWPIVQKHFVADLMQIEASESGGRVRFTERGQAVADYL